MFHTDSVEDIQFSPTEEFAFASCKINFYFLNLGSVDKSIKICDIRVNKKS
jgi:hypothetical protein